MTAVSGTGYPFALLLTHDVDRPFKTKMHALYYALRERDSGHIHDALAGENTYWQFDAITALEDDLGVRSAFYFLSEPPVTQHALDELLDPTTLVQKIGRYDVRRPDIAETIRRLDADGWEVGLHGSYHSPTDRSRLRAEKAAIESVLDGRIVGGRQHYLNLAVPETWRHHRAIGLQYDASLGSTTDYGFQEGYSVRRPFDDEFVVFPLTLMEAQLPDPGVVFSRAWTVCESLLETAARESAVMTTLFHPRYFSERDFPGYRRLYRRLVEHALDRGAWIGPPREFYEVFLDQSTDGETGDGGSEQNRTIGDR